MSAIHKITCDGCGNDLTSTDYVPGFRLTLRSECLPFTGHTMACAMVYPPIKEPVHFCTIKCLRLWLDEESRK